MVVGFLPHSCTSVSPEKADVGFIQDCFFPPRECEGGREGKNVESICNRIVLIDLLE